MWSNRQIPQSSGLERKGETTGGVSYTAQNNGILSKHLLKKPTLKPPKAAYLRIGSTVREEQKRPPDSPKTCDPKPKAEEYVKPLCPSSKMWAPPPSPSPARPSLVAQLAVAPRQLPAPRIQLSLGAYFGSCPHYG